MQGLLVRVGIDQQYGRWNGPADERTRRFMFVPIPDSFYNPSNKYVKGGRRTYREVLPALHQFALDCGNPSSSAFRLPAHLHGAAMHLDPDFLTLTYGDLAPRARRLATFDQGDFVAFYSSLRSVQTRKLIYALVGLFVLQSPPLAVCNIPEAECLLNAHTRWKVRDPSHIVMHGQERMSGLFRHYIQIGERRGAGNHYRVKAQLLKAWGDLTVKDGWIQRSATPPAFMQPERFLEWLQQQGYEVSPGQYQVR